MKKQTVIVTGASSGIGLGIAKYFLDRGYNVLMSSFSAGKLEAAYLQLGGGENLAWLTGDVGDKATGIALAAKAVERFGSIDVLVNDAGIFERKPFLDVDEAYLDKFLKTNLKGTFFTTQAVIPQMLKQKGGAIINIGTSLVTRSFAGVDVSALISSKGAIHALTIELAAEFGKFNIRTNAVAPGVIRSAKQTPGEEDTYDQSARTNLLNRVGEIEDVAAMVYAIATGPFINGAIFDVDGGLA